MGDVGFEIGWQIDNVDCAEWAFLGADTASNAQSLGNKGDFRFRSHFDAEASDSHNRARLLAFLSAFLEQLSTSNFRLWRV
jgi:hypothetical protein